jgi:hypothetical protein
VVINALKDPEPEQEPAARELEDKVEQEAEEEAEQAADYMINIDVRPGMDNINFN